MILRLFLSFLIYLTSMYNLVGQPLIDYVKTDSQVQEESKSSTYKQSEYLQDWTKPWDFGDPNQKIEFRFNNTELSTLIEYFKTLFNITFITDDALNPLPKDGKSIIGSKITFTTNKSFTKKEAWAIFTTYLDLAGYQVIPGPAPRVFKITTTDPKSPLSASKNPLPLFIDTSIESLPADDSVIRYIAFIKATSLETIGNLLIEIKSATSPRPIVVPDMRAIILTDKASNIRNMLAIIHELDKASPTEVLRVLKLDRIDATKAVNLYKELVKTEDPSLTARLLGQRKKPQSNYFSENVRLTAVPAINSIVMIGNKESVQRVYDFIQKTLDRRVDSSYTPIFTYALKHIEATQMAKILNDATRFQLDTDAAKSGGVRDGDKFFKPVFVEAEKTGNRLIIYADYDDYTKIYNLLKKVDIEQPQVALKVLLLSIDLTENKQIGSQLRNKVPGVNGLLGNNVNFQTSGFGSTGSSVIENPNATGAARLLGDLIQLASLSGNMGSTLLTLGADIDGVWGMLSILEQYAKTSVVANPFFITTNKYPATLTVGTTRRVIDSTIQNGSATTTNGFKDLSAALTLNVTPQISHDGLISLDVLINFEQFTSPNDSETSSTSGNRSRQAVQTSVIMGNNEVLALGGLVQETINETITKVPVLGDIPILGNLFKNTTKEVLRTSLLVLILPEVIPANNDAIANKITEQKILDTKTVFFEPEQQRDPLLRWFFKDKISRGQAIVEDFEGISDRYIDESQYSRNDRPARLNKQDDVRSELLSFFDDTLSPETRPTSPPTTPVVTKAPVATPLRSPRQGNQENEQPEQEMVL